MYHNKLRTAISIVAALLATSLLFVLVLAIIKVAVRPNDVSGGQNVSDRQSIREIDGVKYRQKNSINYLLIGVDKYGGINPDNSLYYNTQQADFLAVLSFDLTTDSYTIFHINRDTMTTYKQLGVGGYGLGMTYGQIALSHTEGSGGLTSAYNTINAVKNYLYGITIDYFVTFTMDVMSLIADDIVDIITNTTGHGISVNLNEGQSLDGIGLTQSEIYEDHVILHGDDALRFVRARSGVDDQTNLSRMVRQQEFITGFFSLLIGKNLTDSQLFSCYDTLTKDDYVLTSANKQDLYSLFRYASQIKNNGTATYTYKGIVEPKGETTIVDNHVRFLVDEEDLKRLVVDIFFDKA